MLELRLLMLLPRLLREPRLVLVIDWIELIG
jgi:hypothetical protein